jgi:short chain dehydrogenase
MRTGRARSAGLALVAAGVAPAIAFRAKRVRRAFTFSGKSVVITGGSRGLGLVLARQLAAEGAPSHVMARRERTAKGRGRYPWAATIL